MALAFHHADGQIGPKVAVIAELGVNHDGSVQRALDLVEIARSAGADAVKLQYFHPDRLLSAEAQLAAYQEPSAASPRELLAPLALGLEDLGRIGEAARRAGLAFIVTPFSVEDVGDLLEVAVDAVKIASPDAVNTPLLNAVAAINRPVIVSTGTCATQELGVAAGVARLTRGALLQAISSYPTPDEQAGLGGIAVLREQFELPTGYSDHTPSPVTPALAVAAGACIVEKHLTWSTTAAGPDHAASLGPEDFALSVKLVRQAAAMLGPSVKRVQPCEADVFRVSRQSLCALRDLPVGHVLRRGDLTIKRPGVGLPAAELDAVVGRPLARGVAADHLLREDDLA